MSAILSGLPFLAHSIENRREKNEIINSEAFAFTRCKGRIRVPPGRAHRCQAFSGAPPSDLSIDILKFEEDPPPSKNPVCTASRGFSGFGETKQTNF
jgi:hypothetical protein